VWYYVGKQLLNSASTEILRVVNSDEQGGQLWSSWVNIELKVQLFSLSQIASNNISIDQAGMPLQSFLWLLMYENNFLVE